jgi:GNAT superfamily N-acetyltransferase
VTAGAWAGEISFVEPRADLYAGWRPLYGVYGESVGDPVNDDIARTVWSWLLAGAHGLGAILAVGSDGGVAGFAHYRPFPRTLHGNQAGYLDDLFVAAPLRGRGLAVELVRRVCEIAERNGWTEVRWVTTPDNARARAIYERVAMRSELITYRALLSAGR